MPFKFIPSFIISEQWQVLEADFRKVYSTVESRWYNMAGFVQPDIMVDGLNLIEAMIKDPIVRSN